MLRAMTMATTRITERKMANPFQNLLRFSSRLSVRRCSRSLECVWSRMRSELP
jgi:hypothetical protein